MRKQLIVCVLLGASLGASCEMGYGQNPETPRVWNDRLEPHWSADHSRFWYRTERPNQDPEFWCVDVGLRTKTRAFDPEEVARALVGPLSRPVEPNDLDVERLEFTEVPRELRLICRNGARYRWNAETSQVVIEQAGHPTGHLVLFLPRRASRDHGAPVRLELVNRLSYPVELLWVDPTERLSSRGVIAPGDRFQQSTFQGHVWLLRKGEEDLACFETPGEQLELELTDERLSQVDRQPAQPSRSRGRRGSRGGGRPIPAPNRPQSPDQTFEVFVQDHNLWRRDLQDQEALPTPLTTDATPEHSFQRDASRARLVSMQFGLPDFAADLPLAFWSPDSAYVIAFQTTRVPERSVTYVESSPQEQLHPRVHHYPYAKPGDPLPVSTPRLFERGGREIPLSKDLFPNPFELRFERFSTDSRRAYFIYNQRGHQCLRLLELELATGKVRTVIEETSPTFIHYSDGGKFFLHWKDDDTLLWASERSGWNHLYCVDVKQGVVRHALTSGAWNVKRVEHVDDEHVWLYAVGIMPDQDPYHEHYCRVALDGSGWKVLTAGDGTHRIEWGPGRQVFLDRYSRVDLPPITELREGSEGDPIVELARAEVTGLGTEPGPVGRRLPERFVAKGRDGATDIWGIVHWPSNFDPSLKYPVIEQIYAGPHDQHVPKSFAVHYPLQQGIADAGFVVVQIDGMGTAWRSKAFHDVCYRNLRDSGFPDRIAWIKALAAQYPQVDAQRVGVFGGSAGGQNAMAALLWFSDFYSVAAADCGCHDNRMDKVWWNEQWMGELGDQRHYIENSNMENAHRLQGHLLLTVGEADRNVDPATTLQVVNRLIKADKDFTFLPVIGGGHGSGESAYAARKRLEFFQKHLGLPRERD